MPERVFSWYTLTVRAGPGHVEVTADVVYYDTNNEPVGTYGESLIGFCTTWKDVAQVVRTGLAGQGLDTDPVVNVSPMVDLS
jgi:hypothetical protein